MNFIALAQQLIVPGNLLLVLLTSGVILTWFVRTRTAGVILGTSVAIFFLMVEYSPLAAWVTAPLEERFANTRIPNRVDGLIVLGGAVNTSMTVVHGMPALNAEAERMTEFVRLAKLYPKARLVFSGGAGSQEPAPTMSEADVARLFFSQQGLNSNRITFESHSQNTYENVLLSKRLVQPRRGENWILVASAQDVPRCVAVFRKFQWPVIPWPVAYKSDPSSGGNFSDNLKAFDRSSHEWIGLLFYKLTGKSDELFPAPGGGKTR